ncbi:MAG: hypothetical protein ABWW69_01040 [Pyrodictiaceae archaeon]
MAAMIKRFDLDAISSIFRLYAGNPCSHVFLYHDLFIEPFFTSLFIVSRDSDIKGYLLLHAPP